jgi:hypothetical protein
LEAAAPKDTGVTGAASPLRDRAKRHEINRLRPSVKPGTGQISHVNR